MENTSEIWQTEVNGQIYETTFEGLAQWIGEGSLLPQDRVRRANLRWIEAQRVPALHRFFNAKELGIALPTVSTPTEQENLETQTFSLNSPQQFIAQQQTFNEPPPPQFYQELGNSSATNFCALHANAKAAYFCETCSNCFCQACPSGEVCPMCGAMCNALQVPIVSATLAVTEPPIQTTPVINDDVRKGANWFFWKAGMTLLNAFLMMVGIDWAFFLGATITQVLHGVADGLSVGLSSENGATGVTAFHAIVFAICLVYSGFFVMLGYQAGRAKKWAFIIGLIIYAFDGLIYLLTLSFFGIIIHVLAIFVIAKGMSAIKKNK